MAKIQEEHLDLVSYVTFPAHARTTRIMTSGGKKLVSLIEDADKFSFSLEVTPDVKNEDLENLELDPAFFAVTWHAKSHQCKDLDIPPLKTATFLRSKQKQVLMHLSCDLMKKHYLEKVLAYLQEKGICNLFLVLGESFDPNTSDFITTLELLMYIREISGAYFCIGVAGFCESSEDKLVQLKKKIDAGADFIVTQAFFEANVLKDYREKCTKIGINVPIIPGVFAFENYKQLINFTNTCKIKVSEDLLNYAKKNEGKETAGLDVAKNLIQTIRSENAAVHFHFFTINKLINVCEIIKQIQI